MSPDEFAERVPRLFHVTDRQAWPLIERHGLLSTNSMIDRFVRDPERADRLRSERRGKPVPLYEGETGERAMLNDNIPLIFSRLAGALDDGLTPVDWLQLLNKRVYFFPSREKADSFIEAGRRGGRTKLMLTFDAHSLATAHLDRLFIAPINTGSALRTPARRGHAIFAPVASVSWDEFAARRATIKKSPDTVAEVSLLGDLPDAANHLAAPPEEI